MLSTLLLRVGEAGRSDGVKVIAVGIDVGLGNELNGGLTELMFDTGRAGCGRGLWFEAVMFVGVASGVECEEGEPEMLIIEGLW